jgi:hypothetical protein
LPFMPTDIQAKLALAERVGRELRRLGLDKHVAHARRYYSNVRARRAPGDREWDDSMVVEWARILRLPPYEKDYEVKPRMSKCGCPTPRPSESDAGCIGGEDAGEGTIQCADYADGIYCECVPGEQGNCTCSVTSVGPNECAVNTAPFEGCPCCPSTSEIRRVCGVGQ